MLASVLSLVMLTAPGAALAAGVDSVAVSRPVTLPCSGVNTAIMFDVSATYSGLNDRVVVTVDATTVYGPVSDDSAVFTVGPIVTGEGAHTIVATTYDSLLGDLEDEDILAQDIYVFDIDCTRGEGFLIIDSGNANIYQSDQPSQGGTDCCPGPGGDSGAHDDGDAPVVQKKAKVAGTTTTAPMLAPINSMFRSVFGRTPTFEEWTYWADRMLTDKPELDALFGAMQWHKLHGNTVGK